MSFMKTKSKVSNKDQDTIIRDDNYHVVETLVDKTNEVVNIKKQVRQQAHLVKTSLEKTKKVIQLNESVANLAQNIQIEPVLLESVGTFKPAAKVNYEELKHLEKAIETVSSLANEKSKAELTAEKDFFEKLTATQAKFKKSFDETTKQVELAKKALESIKADLDTHFAGENDDSEELVLNLEELDQEIELWNIREFDAESCYQKAQQNVRKLHIKYQQQLDRMDEKFRQELIEETALLEKCKKENEELKKELDDLNKDGLKIKKINKQLSEEIKFTVTEREQVTAEVEDNEINLAMLEENERNQAIVLDELLDKRASDDAKLATQKAEFLEVQDAADILERQENELITLINSNQKQVREIDNENEKIGCQVLSIQQESRQMKLEVSVLNEEIEAGKYCEEKAKSKLEVSKSSLNKKDAILELQKMALELSTSKKKDLEADLGKVVQATNKLRSQIETGNKKIDLLSLMENLTRFDGEGNVCEATLEDIMKERPDLNELMNEVQSVTADLQRKEFEMSKEADEIEALVKKLKAEECSFDEKKEKERLLELDEEIKRIKDEQMNIADSWPTAVMTQSEAYQITMSNAKDRTEKAKLMVAKISTMLQTSTALASNKAEIEKIKNENRKLTEQNI